VLIYIDSANCTVNNSATIMCFITYQVLIKDVVSSRPLDGKTRQ